MTYEILKFDEMTEHLCPACHKRTGWQPHTICALCGYDDAEFWKLIHEIGSLRKQVPIVKQALEDKAWDIRDNGSLWKTPVAAQLMELRRDLAFIGGLVIGGGR